MTQQGFLWQTLRGLTYWSFDLNTLWTSYIEYQLFANLQCSNAIVGKVSRKIGIITRCVLIVSG